MLSLLYYRAVQPFAQLFQLLVKDVLWQPYTLYLQLCAVPARGMDVIDLLVCTKVILTHTSTIILLLLVYIIALVCIVVEQAEGVFYKVL